MSKDTVKKISAEDKAVQLAVILDSDPIAAGLIKKHLSEKRLIELLDLKTPAADLAEQAIIQDPAPLQEMEKKTS